MTYILAGVSLHADAVDGHFTALIPYRGVWLFYNGLCNPPLMRLADADLSGQFIQHLYFMRYTPPSRRIRQNINLAVITLVINNIAEKYLQLSRNKFSSRKLIRTVSRSSMFIAFFS